MTDIIKILIVDDHKLIREGVKQLLTLQQKFIAQYDEAENGNDAIEKEKENDYDVILMDIQMPETNGMEATKAIIRKNKKMKIIALTMFDEDFYIQQMIRAGASGYVLKSTGPEELSNAIIAVMKEKKFYSNEVALKLIEPHYKDILQPEGSISAKIKLTRRENEIVQMIAQEKTSAEIAAFLHIAKRTVDGHRERIMKKLNVSSVTGLIKYALKNTLFFIGIYYS